MIFRKLVLASVFAIPVFAQPVADSADVKSSWTVNGSVGAEFGYHSVVTQKNETDEDYDDGYSTIQPGSKYKNYFQVPGFYGAWNAFVQMQSETGQKIELTMDVSHDSWNHFDLKFLQASYEDRLQKLILGDFNVSNGDLYLSGVDVFGASYDFYLNVNRAPQNPLFVLSAFGGETVAPKLPGERDPDQYNMYIGLDEVVAQKMVVGGKVLLNATKNLDATIGFIGSKDYLDDPFFRDGTSGNVNLSNPMFSSKTLFGEVNGKVLGGRGKYNFQFGFGGADTVNVVTHRAVNAIFEEAGLDVSRFAQLRRLMNNRSLVNSMSKEELELIFGDNTGMSVSDMRTALNDILKEAEDALKTHRDKEKDDPTDWTAQNLAVSGSYNWKYKSTMIDAYFRFVGRNYYSAGSSDMLQNSRLLGAKLDQKIKDFWQLNFGYELNIENASGSGDAYNVFGFAEGSKLGLLPGADDDWLEKHEQDDYRTLYDHNLDLKNTFKVRDSIEIMARYAMNYRTRSSSQRLHGNFFASSGIYSDSWFEKQKGKPTIDVETDDGTIQIDSARWAKYAALQDEPYLATQFEERLLKHTFELEATIRFPKNVLKVGGVWTYRTDMSRFNQDDLLDGFDFSDETYGILGYYFHGGDYLDARYPISLTTTLDRFRNTLALTPSFRIYNRDDESEFEWNLMDNATIQLKPNVLDMMLYANIRQNFMSRKEDGEKIEEMEMDLDLSAGLKWQINEQLSTECTFGAFFNYRPDYAADDYRDIYGMISMSYDF